MDVPRNTSFISTVLSECDYTPQIALDLTPGWRTIELAKKLPQSHIVGLVVSPRFDEVVSNGWSGQEEAVVDNLNMVYGSLEELPFEDGTFDLLLFLFEQEGELHEAGRLGPCLREIGRVLAIDGISVINFPNTGAEERESSKGTSNHPATMEIISILSKPYFLNYLKIVKKELNLGIAFKRIR